MSDTNGSNIRIDGEQKSISMDDLMKSSTQGDVQSQIQPMSDPSASQPTQVEAVDHLTDADQQQVDEIAKSIDLTKNDLDSSYGAEAQRTMGQFAESILSNTRSKDAGQAGQLMQSLVTTIDDSHLSGVKKVPIIGKIVMKTEEIKRQYQKVTPQIDDIVDKLLQSQAQMQADIAMYDTMYDKNLEQYKSLKIYVAAGRKSLNDFREQQLPALEQQSTTSGDPMQAQILKDFKDKLDRFEKRLDDLDRISVVSLQNAPQIKILQNADRKIADKVNTTITTTIPLWKSQMVIALGLARQNEALKLQNSVDDTTNKLLSQNAAALHTGVVNAEKANQRSVVDIETLQKVNSELIATLKETQQIQEDGRKKRAAAEDQMREIEANLRTALMDNITSA
jgi:uncharacterized protein YaaN involved in tellurite resistance